VAQCASPQSWSVHPVDLQQRAAGGHLALDHGNSGPLQRLRPGVPGICPTLPHGMHPGLEGLECFPKCLGRMGGAQPPLHYLALRSSWGVHVRRRGRPPGPPLLPHGWLLLPETTPWTSIATTRVAFPTRDNPSTFLGAFCSIIYGPKDAEGILMASTPSKGSCSNLGRLRRRWAWPLGRPLYLLARIGLRTIRIALSLPLGLNGFTATSLGRARLPFLGACSPPCTFSIFLMIDGAVASLPVRGSPCVWPWDQHPNVILSWDSKMGVPKFPQVGLLQLWEPITLHANL
jgi:hypothetical protein